MTGDRGTTTATDAQPDDPQLPATSPTDRVESYEEGGSTVLYDALNPLAWLEASHATPVAENR